MRVIVGLFRGRGDEVLFTTGFGNHGIQGRLIDGLEIVLGLDVELEPVDFFRTVMSTSC